jgi:hypothetical protein
MFCRSPLHLVEVRRWELDSTHLVMRRSLGLQQHRDCNSRVKLTITSVKTSMRARAEIDNCKFGLICRATSGDSVPKLGFPSINIVTGIDQLRAMLTYTNPRDLLVNVTVHPWVP